MAEIDLLRPFEFGCQRLKSRRVDGHGFDLVRIDGGRGKDLSRRASGHAVGLDFAALDLCGEDDFLDGFQFHLLECTPRGFQGRAPKGLGLIRRDGLRCGEGGSIRGTPGPYGFGCGRCGLGIGAGKFDGLQGAH